MGSYALALILLLVLATGCSAGSEPSTPTEVAPGREEPLTRAAGEEALNRFVKAAGRGDTSVLWELVSARTRSRFAPESALATADVADGLASFARGGGYEVVLSEPVSLDWSVAAVARGEEAHAFALRIGTGGWRRASMNPLQTAVIRRRTRDHFTN